MPQTARSTAFGWLAEHPLVCALAVQSTLLFNNLGLLEPWRDEALTLTIAGMPAGEIFGRVQATHPPVYFLLAHFVATMPGSPSPLWKLRFMSALWTLAATVFLDQLILRKESASIRRWVLALWVLSPCLLLYARMARSYSMQLALAMLAIAAAVRWFEQPRSMGRLLTYALAVTALLYTHFLPGIAIAGAVGVVFLARPGLTIAVRAGLLALTAAIIVLVYLPVLPSLAEGIGWWNAVAANSGHDTLLDQVIRLAWWFVSFSFGETLTTFCVVLGAILSPIIVYAVYRGATSKPAWVAIVGVATVIGYIGVSGWSGYPFTPARQLFVLPFFLILIVMGARTMRYGTIVLAAIAAVYLAGDYNYFTTTGFLNKEYCAPFGEMAATINGQSPQAGAVVALDDESTFLDPLVGRLNPRLHVVELQTVDSATPAMQAYAGRPGVIWILRHSHDTSESQWVSKLEDEIAHGRSVKQFGFLPYSGLEYRILTALRGPGQPRYFYILDRYE